MIVRKMCDSSDGIDYKAPNFAYQPIDITILQGSES